MRLIETGTVPDLILLHLAGSVQDGIRFRAAQQANPIWGTTPMILLADMLSADLLAHALDVAAELPAEVQPKNLLRTITSVLAQGALPLQPIT